MAKITFDESLDAPNWDRQLRECIEEIAREGDGATRLEILQAVVNVVGLKTVTESLALCEGPEDRCPVCGERRWIEFICPDHE